jgi:hypothetical protein
VCVCGGIGTGSDSGIYTVDWWKREQDGNAKKIKSTNIPILVPVLPNYSYLENNQINRWQTGNTTDGFQRRHGILSLHGFENFNDLLSFLITMSVVILLTNTERLLHPAHVSGFQLSTFSPTHTHFSIWYNLISDMSLK